LEQFEVFIDQMMDDGILIYCANDEQLDEACYEYGQHLDRRPYETPDYHIQDGVTHLELGSQSIPVSVFGEHNLQNLEGARSVCEALGIDTDDFYEAIADFKGAARRLEEVERNDDTIIYKDFAHSPSKLSATVKAVKTQWPNRTLIACMELHTFSSLTKEFLQEYAHTMDEADEAVVFFKEDTIKQKRLEPISADEVRSHFQRQDLLVFTDSDSLRNYLLSLKWKGKNLLMMSSGNFGGVDVTQLAEEIID